jgi:hypothetical protein
MLFDLRGRGRRRTVRVVYIGLALLIGVGLVGFGIGGGFGGGGILSAASENEGASKASFASKVKKYQKLTREQPGNAADWEELTKALLGETGGSQGGLSNREKELFQEASQSWSSYLALNPRQPSVALASEMVRVYGVEGLNQPAQAVQALQIVVAARPTSASLWAALAEYAYKASNRRIGDLAATKAVALAPASARTSLQRELAEVKTNPSGEKTYTTTTNGKTYALKKAGNGTFTGSEVPTTPKTATTKK